MCNYEYKCLSNTCTEDKFGGTIWIGVKWIKNSIKKLIKHVR